MISYNTKILYLKLNIVADMQKLIVAYGQNYELDVSMMPIHFFKNKISAFRIDYVDNESDDIYVDMRSDDDTIESKKFQDFDVMDMVNMYEWTYIHLLFLMYNVEYEKKKNKTASESAFDPILKLYDKSIGMRATFNIDADEEAMHSLAVLFNMAEKYPAMIVNNKQIEAAYKKMEKSGKYPAGPIYVTLEIVKYNKRICLSAKTSSSIGKDIVIPINKLSIIQMMYYYHIIHQNQHKHKDDDAVLY